MFGMAGVMKTFQTAKAKEMLPWAKDRTDGFVRFVGHLGIARNFRHVSAHPDGHPALADAAGGGGTGSHSGTGDFQRAFAEEGI